MILYNTRASRSLFHSISNAIVVCVCVYRAVSSLALWVAALLDYHHARDIVKPFQDKLATAEDILKKVNTKSTYLLSHFHSYCEGSSDTGGKTERYA